MSKSAAVRYERVRTGQTVTIQTMSGPVEAPTWRYVPVDDVAVVGAAAADLRKDIVENCPSGIAYRTALRLFRQTSECGRRVAAQLRSLCIRIRS